MSHNYHAIIEIAYDAFNRREIDEVLSLMDSNVHWPNGWEGGYVIGHAGVRDYWMRQWRQVNPTVSPVSITQLDNDHVEVLAHQLVKDMEDKILVDGLVKHLYTFRNWLISNMEIQPEMVRDTPSAI